MGYDASMENEALKQAFQAIIDRNALSQEFNAILSEKFALLAEQGQLVALGEYPKLAENLKSAMASLEGKDIQSTVLIWVCLMQDSFVELLARNNLRLIGVLRLLESGKGAQ